MLDIVAGLSGIGASVYFLAAVFRSWPALLQSTTAARGFAIAIAADAVAAAVVGIMLLTRQRNGFVALVAVSFAAVMLRLLASWTGGNPSGFWWELLPGLYGLYRFVDPSPTPQSLAASSVPAPSAPAWLLSFVQSKRALVLAASVVVILMVAFFFSRGHHYNSPADYFSSRRIELGALGYGSGGNEIVDGREAEWIVWGLADGSRQQDLLVADRDGGVRIIAGSTVAAGRSLAGNSPRGFEVPVAGN